MFVYSILRTSTLTLITSIYVSARRLRDRGPYEGPEVKRYKLAFIHTAESKCTLEQALCANMTQLSALNLSRICELLLWTQHVITIFVNFHVKKSKKNKKIHMKAKLYLPAFECCSNILTYVNICCMSWGVLWVVQALSCREWAAITQSMAKKKNKVEHKTEQILVLRLSFWDTYSPK